MYGFAAASPTEPTVFGAARPGYSDRQVIQWLEFMNERNIKRVCCLLAPRQLFRYSNLLDTYRQNFGRERVWWTPIKDFYFVDLNVLLEEILPFLITAEEQRERVVVHCSGGIGRTGQILTVWLVAKRDLSNQEAISVVKSTGRNPHEAVLVTTLLTGKMPQQVVNAFDTLLNNCRAAVQTFS